MTDLQLLTVGRVSVDLVFNTGVSASECGSTVRDPSCRKVEIFVTQKGLDLLAVLDPVTDQINRQIVSNLDQLFGH